jgi:non-ribosomal peptide synthetase component F
MRSVADIDLFDKNQIVVQMSRCSFDIHVQEIMGTLNNGATVVVLRPRGSIDFEYLSKVLARKQITYMDSVPSLFHSFFHFLEDFNRQNALEYMKFVCSAGM